MGSNRAAENKLRNFLQSVETQYPFSTKNFVSMEKLTFLWIIGEDGRMEELLKTEIKSIVADKRTIWIIKTSAEDMADEKAVFESFSEGIECASQNYLDVDLESMMVCPILLPGCFEQEESREKFIAAALYVQWTMNRNHRFLEWSPFVLISDKEIEKTRNQMDTAVWIMDALMEEGRKRNLANCCPACVISDKNEKSQAISEEQKAKAIVMLTVFRNTHCKDGEMLNSVMRPITPGEEQYFFTVRAISICEPVKSLMLNRLLAVHNSFQEGKFSQAKIFDDLVHGFFSGSRWKEQLDKLPHDEKYTVLTAPLYSNIPRPDQKEYEKVLMDFCQEYYLDPLDEDKEELSKEWWNSFMEEFFMIKAGSVESLDHLEENRERIREQVPSLTVQPSGFANDMRRGCEVWLIRELKEKQRNLADFALNPEGRYMQQFRDNKKNLKAALGDLDERIRNLIQRLRQTELLLNTGGGHVANPKEEAERWFSDYTNNEPQKVREIYGEYQKILCELFKLGTEQKESVEEQLLDNYNRIVSGSIESRVEYMHTKLSNLAGSDMNQIISRLGESWLYPLRLIGSTDQGKNQKLYILGNPENFLCRMILQQDNFQVAFKECALDDRLEIVRVSDRLRKQDIISQELEGEEIGSL